MEPNQRNPYDFILSNKSKRPVLLKFGGSQKQRILQVVIGGGLLLILFVLIFSLIFGGSGKVSTDLYQIAASQQDIIGLTTLGIGNLQDQQLVNQTQTIEIVISSQAKSTTSYLSTHGVSKIAKKIAPYQSAQYKTTLANAKINGQYDTTFQSILADQLGSYKTKLKTAYASAKSNVLKSQLADEYAQINTLSASN
jgi:hypothetical protein